LEKEECTRICSGEKARTLGKAGRECLGREVESRRPTQLSPVQCLSDAEALLPLEEGEAMCPVKHKLSVSSLVNLVTARSTHDINR
jgi:hypothetical protein